ncbi:MAG: PIN domain-containing protein [bacterium]
MAAPATKYLLDTNILVAYIRANALGQYVEESFALRASHFRPLIRVVTVGEIRVLASRWRWGTKKQQAMERLLSELVWVDISDPEVLDAYVLVDTSRPRGKEIPQNDRWIAAAARATGSRLLSTDRHFGFLPDGLLDFEWIDEELVKPQ